MIEEDTLIFGFVIILSCLIIFVWDYNRWKISSELYRKFKKRDLSDTKMRDFIKEVINDYDKRDESFSEFRRDMIESKRKTTFILFSLLGHLFSIFFFTLIISVENQNIFLIFSLIILIVLISLCLIHSSKWRNIKAAGMYLFRSIASIVASIAFIMIFLYNQEPLLVERTLDSGWYTSVSSISFGIAIGLFITLSISQFLKKEWKIRKDIEEEFEQLIMSKYASVNKLSNLYEKESFQKLMDNYTDSSMPSRSVKMLSISFVGFNVIGFYALWISSLPLTELDITEDPMTSEGIIMASFFFLILIITLGFLSFIYSVVLDPSFYEGKE